jgi:hypothetical protein
MKKGGSAKGLVSQIEGTRMGVRSFIAIVGGAVATHIAGTAELIDSARIYFRATAENWSELIDACDNLIVAHEKWAESIGWDALVGTTTRTERKATKEEVQTLKDEGRIPENTH